MDTTSNNKILKYSETCNFSNYQFIKLLKRLDSEEGLSEPSIEEKLKLAEDHLRLSCTKFCEATCTLLEDKNIDAEPDIMETQTVQELLDAKCFKRSFRSPRSKLRTLNRERIEISTLKPATHEKKVSHAARKKLKQAHYLPPPSWFSEKPNTDLTSEEVELLSSPAVKTFARFLEEKRKEILRIFSPLQSSTITKNINQHD